MSCSVSVYADVEVFRFLHRYIFHTAVPICQNLCSVLSPPNLPVLLCPQFAAWVDAVVFVFSLEDEISFQTVYNYFLRLNSYRNTAEVPMVLVGTQGVCLRQL